MKQEYSDIIKMPSGVFRREIMRRFAPWWIWGGVALSVAGFAIALVLQDVRWAILGFMVLLIMLPMALAICYFNHALCRECFVNVLPHTVDVDGDMLTVTLLEKEESGDGMTEADYRPLRKECFDGDKVVGWSIRGDAGYAELRDRMRGFLWVPVNVSNFEGIAEFARRNRVMGDMNKD